MSAAATPHPTEQDDPDRYWMARALELARRGLLTTTPNPRVGCLVLDAAGELTAEGWHEKAGLPHAEVHALARAGTRATGGTVYVTLEPCSHHGRTPPCVDALLAARPRRVVVAMEDPNPDVHGRGIARLRAAGVEVSVGVLSSEAHALNVGFVQRMTHGRPWVRLKVAMSLDGQTALQNGVSQWITGPRARADGHRWRARSCAVLTGIGTLLSDDPALTVRAMPVTRQPIRVLLDTRLRAPPSAQFFATPGTLVFHGQDETSGAVRDRVQALHDQGAEVIRVPLRAGRLDLEGVLGVLAARGTNELLIEAGAHVNGAFLEAGLVNELLVYKAAVLIGPGRPAAYMSPVESLDQVVRWKVKSVDGLGEDLAIVLSRQG